jgi:hypothetical protein
VHEPVWDLATGQQQAVLAGHTSSVWSVAVTADGARAHHERLAGHDD